MEGKEASITDIQQRKDLQAKLDEERVMNEILKELQAEQPKIDQSLKNFLTVVTAKSSSLVLEAKIANVTVESSSTLQKAHPAINVNRFTPTSLLSFVKLFLSALQETPLLDVSLFFHENPQGSHESAVDYLNKICFYKGIFFLREKVLVEKQKISKYFGKSYFLHTNIWKTIKENFLVKIEKSSNFCFNRDEVSFLLTIYEESIFQNSCDNDEGKKGGTSFSSSTAVAVNTAVSTSDMNGYCELIWSKNFQESLSLFQKKRIEVIHRRQQEEEKEREEEQHQQQQEQGGSSSSLEQLPPLPPTNTDGDHVNEEIRFV
jgi:hypothetical protein